MFFVLSKIVALFLDPLLWFLLLTVAALLLRKRDKWRQRLTTAAWLVLLVFSNPYLLELSWQAWEYPVSHPSDVPQTFKYAVVLGGHSDSRASDPEKLVLGHDPNRLTDAIRLYKTGKVEKLVLTGGSGALFGERVSEAPLAAAFLKDLGIPDDAILVEGESRNTHENATNTAALLGAPEIMGKPVLLVTSAFHMRRSVPTFEREGFSVIPYATDAKAHHGAAVSFQSFVPSPWALAEWHFLLKEWIGYVAYKVL